MTTATDTDLQQVKDLITAGNAATQKQIADLAASTQKQMADLTASTQKQFADLTQRVEVSFAEVKGDIRELRSELKALDTKFDEKTKSLDQRIRGFPRKHLPDACTGNLGWCNGAPPRPPGTPPPEGNSLGLVNSLVGIA